MYAHNGVGTPVFKVENIRLFVTNLMHGQSDLKCYCMKYIPLIEFAFEMETEMEDNSIISEF
jgi:hypothetical protein